MAPKEFDALLLGYRVYCRDYECDEFAHAVLEELEAVSESREVGGRVVWQPPGWEEDGPEDNTDPGGALVPA